MAASGSGSYFENNSKVLENEVALMLEGEERRPANLLPSIVTLHAGQALMQMTSVDWSSTDVDYIPCKLEVQNAYYERQHMTYQQLADNTLSMAARKPYLLAAVRSLEENIKYVIRARRAGQKRLLIEKRRRVKKKLDGGAVQKGKGTLIIRSDGVVMAYANRSPGARAKAAATAKVKAKAKAKAMQQRTLSGC